jgi:hypothetical protein
MMNALEIGDVRREKIHQILYRKPQLASKIFNARMGAKSDVEYKVESNRLINVIVKLAKGHALYELNDPQVEAPTKISIISSFFQNSSNILHEENQKQIILPEIGSRAIQRAAIEGEGVSFPWVIVQPGRYRYATTIGDGISIRIIISEYFSCEVVWE